MKQSTRLIAIAALAMQAIGLTAQNLQTYHVVGDVTYMKDGSSQPLVMQTIVTPSTVVNVPYGGKLELIDPTNSKRITISQPGKGTVEVLSKAEGNTVANVSERYVAYVKNQMTNKGLTAQKRYTDFATVTRAVEQYVEENQKPKTFADRFNEFKDRTRKEYDEFRRKNNETYANFVRQAWQKIGAQPPIEVKHREELKPVVYNDTTTTDRLRIFGAKERGVEKVVRFQKEELEVLRDKKQPKPATPEKKLTLPSQKEPDIPIEKVEVPEPMQQYATMPVDFYGQELSVHIDETKRLHLGAITPDNVADILQKQLSTKYYDNLLIDCLNIRSKLKLCDWAYMLLLEKVAEEFCGENTNEAELMLGYLLYQSGYKVKFATDNDNRLYLLMACQHIILKRGYYVIDNDKYYLRNAADDYSKALYICPASFPQEKALSLYVPYSQQLKGEMTPVRHLASKRYPDFTLDVSVYRSLINFYSDFPQGFIDPEEYKRWLAYAEAPFDEDLKNKLYPQLHKQLDNLPELEQVERVLNLIQTSMPYAYDDQVWGGDRPFFAEETLFYPGCDCEDRSILFTRIVREVLGLKCVLVYYPGHLAAAVKFNNTDKFNAEGGAAQYKLDGETYTLCDPTYINAPVGAEMDQYRGQNNAILIPLELK